MVACCERCNKLKNEVAPTSADDGFLHPYFDDVTDNVWLVASVVETTPAALVYSVGTPSNLNANLLAKVQSQFEHLKLAKLYSEVASEEIADIENILEETFTADGESGVADHLNRQCISRRKMSKNSWRAAAYYALSKSNWYCRGGFRMV